MHNDSNHLLMENVQNSFWACRRPFLIKNKTTKKVDGLTQDHLLINYDG